MKKWLIPLLTFILVISSSMCAFASSGASEALDVPDLPSDAQYKTYVIYYYNGNRDNKLCTYATNTSNIFYYSNRDNFIYHKTTNGGSVWNEEYCLENGQWVKFGSGSVPSTDSYGTYGICGSGVLKYSTFDIIDKSTDTVFFSQKLPMTLPERVLNLGVVTLNMEVPEVLGAMKTLALCGVGCLALLVSLPVLSKVFYRFRARY